MIAKKQAVRETGAGSVTTVVRMQMDADLVTSGNKDLIVALADEFQGMIAPVMPQLPLAGKMLVMLEWFAFKRAAEHVGDVY